MAIGRPRSFRVPLLALLFVSGLLGCSQGNLALREYSSGEPDVKQLVGLLARSKPKPLVDYSWVPLVNLSVIEFELQNVRAIDKLKEDAPAPDGGAANLPICYALAKCKMYGPIYAVTNHNVRYYDPAGNLTHVHRERNVLWHLWGRETWVTRKNGQWEKTRTRKYLFGLFSSESPVEQPPSPP